MGIVELPLKDSEDVLEIDTNDLPENPEEMIFILTQEDAAPKFYITFALEYYKKKMFREFFCIVEKGFEIASTSNYSLERIQLLICLSNFYINQARQIPNPNLANEYIEKASSYLNQAEALDHRQHLTWFTKGLLLMVKGNEGAAGSVFKNQSHSSSNTVSCLLAQGTISYNKKDYRNALECYQQALRTDPTYDPDIRLGIGLCFGQLGMLKEAGYAFERVLERNPNNVDAICLLGIMDMNEYKEFGDPKIFERSLYRFKKAYSINKQHPVACLHLARMMLVKKEYDKVVTLVENALKNTNSKQLQADGNCIIAQVLHAKGQLDDALKFYQNATKMIPTMITALFGVAQLYLHKGDLKHARVQLEAILGQQPENYVVLKMLGAIYAKSSNEKAKALSYLEKAQSLQPLDYDIKFDIGTLMFEKDPKTSLDAYKATLDSMLQNERNPPPELLNNIGSLILSQGEDFEDAEKHFLSALESTEGNEEAEISIKYNLARLYEKKQKFEKAEELYHEIVAKAENYVDAYLRIGCIEQSKGKFAEATDWFKDVLGFEESNINAWILLGRLQAVMKQSRPSRKTFERILMKCDRRDVYALCSLGNNYLDLARNEQKLERKPDLYKKAVELFEKVLRFDVKNMFAANGIAIALAESGHLEKARDFFIQIRETGGEFKESTLNLAHILVELGHLSQAIVLYEKYLQKCEDPDFTVVLALSRAYYIKARKERCPEDMLNALQFVQKACKLSPGNKMALFDLALVQQQFAQVVLDQPIEKRTIDNLCFSLMRLEESKKLFKVLAEQEDTSKMISQNIASQRQKHSDSLMSNVHKRMHEKRKLEEASKQKIEEMKKKRQLELLEKEDKEREERERAKKLDEEIYQQRKAIMEKVKEENERERAIAEDSQSEEAEKKSKRPKGKKRKDDEEEKEEGNIEYIKPENVPPRKRRIRKKTESKQDLEKEGNSSDEDLFGDKEIEELEETETNSASSSSVRRPKKIPLSSEFVNSSEDEED